MPSGLAAVARLVATHVRLRAGEEESMRKFRIMVLALIMGAVYGLPHRRAHADATGGIPPGGAPPETSGGCAGDTTPAQKTGSKESTAQSGQPRTATDPGATPSTAPAPSKPSYPTYGSGNCGTATTPPCGNPEAPAHGVP
jgi:hypothetical protein